MKQTIKQTFFRCFIKIPPKYTDAGNGPGLAAEGYADVVPGIGFFYGRADVAPMFRLSQ